MIPLYLQRAQYFAERCFFNIFEGARVVRIIKSNKFVPVQRHTVQFITEANLLKPFFIPEHAS